MCGFVSRSLADDLDQAFRVEPGQLWIDLRVTGMPRVADRWLPNRWAIS